MENKELLTSVIMLESIWQAKKMDLIDLITPLVEYEVAKCTPINTQVNTDKLLECMREKYGFSDMPESVLIKVFGRKKNVFNKYDHKYYLVGDLSTIAEKMETKHKQCLISIENIGTKLAEYLNSHCEAKESFNQNSAIEALHQFFIKYAINIGIDNLEVFGPKYSATRKNYFIAEFIISNKEKKTAIYDSIIELLKGFFLKTAIYYQPENKNIISAQYSKISFYYDTSVILSILGYQSEELRKSAIELHEKIKSLGARTCVFKQTVDEVRSVLTAYKYSKENKADTGFYTLDSLDEKGYLSSDVERLISVLENSISRFCSIEDIPSYKVDSDQCVDCSNVLSENDIKNYIKERAEHYKDSSLEHDITVLHAIHRLRDDTSLSEIERSKAIFVTNNGLLTRSFNTYYRTKINNSSFPLIMTSFELSALTWVKAGTIGTLPEKQLLVNSYIATQPTPELMEVFKNLLYKMEQEKEISSEEAMALKTERYIQRELLLSSNGDINAVNEELVLNFRDKLKETYTKEYRQEEENKQKTEHENKVKTIKKDGKIFAEERGNRLFKKIKILVKTVEITIACFTTCFFVIDFLKDKKLSWISIPFLLISIFSFIDFITIKHSFINKFLQKKQFNFEARVCEKYVQDILKYM